jgi:hypothetical protein
VVTQYELHDNTNVLVIGSRYRPSITDDLVIQVGHRNGYAERSVVASRTQVRELVDWLTRWLDQGWPGVRREEGPTSSDVIEHYQRTARRAQIDLDHTRADCFRLQNAALALIPPDQRDTDLEQVAKAQGEYYSRLNAERDALEATRCRLVQALHNIQWARSATADQLRKAAGKVLDQHAHAKPKPVPDPVPEAPIYEVVQLDLIEGAA